MKAYSALASKYDALMKGFDYDGYYQHIEGYLVGKSKGVDLCSGSGELTYRLAEAGKKVIGIDYSSEMLEVARRKARAKGLNITFIEQDASELELPSRYDFVTICCDGVNYIKDTATLFERIAEHLRDDGMLIFDFSTRYKLTHVLGDNVFYEDYSDYTYLWTNKLDAHSVKMDITVFSRDEDGRYSREDESHRQYIKDTDTIEKELMDARFEVMEKVDGESYGELCDTSRRALYIARRGERQ